MSTETWRRCSSCKTDIPFGAKYYACSVSTCNRSRTALYFCSLPCWEAHLPLVRHREAWAEEKVAPARDEWERQRAAGAGGDGARAARKVVAADRRAAPADGDVPHDILIVASKLKAYIRAKSGMRTSDTCLEALSTIVRDACNEAIRRAAADGRQTVMGRDFRRY